MAAKFNIVQKSGTWYSFGEERLGQGRENVKSFLRENQDFTQKIETMVKQQLGMIPEAEAATETEKGIREKSGRRSLKKLHS